MPKRSLGENDRARRMLAQEAARLIVEHGIGDYRVAKQKAAQRLGLKDRGSLPGNPEIEEAVTEHLKLFGRDSHIDLLRMLRQAALSAMDLLAEFAPRLVGPVLNGTAAPSSAVNLHVFSDSAELVAETLQHHRVQFQLFERRLKTRRDRSETYAGFRFTHDSSPIEATVFPVNGIRQAPISPIDGRPMRRADRNAVLALIEGQFT